MVGPKNLMVTAMLADPVERLEHTLVVDLTRRTKLAVIGFGGHWADARSDVNAPRASRMDSATFRHNCQLGSSAALAALRLWVVLVETHGESAALAYPLNGFRRRRWEPMGNGRFS